MKSAAAYTNKRRVMAEAGNTKVEQIGNVATNYGTLQPVLPSQASPLTPVSCGPDFTHYSYFKGCRSMKNATCKQVSPLDEWVAFSSSNINLNLQGVNATKIGGSSSEYDAGIYTNLWYNNFTLTFKLGTGLQEITVGLGTIQQLFGSTRESRIYNSRYALLIHDTTEGGNAECYSADSDSSYAGVTYTDSTIFKMIATATLISFYKDDEFMHSFNRVTLEPLYINISFYKVGNSLKDIHVVNN